MALRVRIELAEIAACHWLRARIRDAFTGARQLTDVGAVLDALADRLGASLG
jgi:hypothetical protein